MNEQIQLPVEHVGVNYEFPLTIVPLGYTYQLHIEANDQVLIFEKDDAGAYWAIGSGSEVRSIDKGLITLLLSH